MSRRLQITLAAVLLAGVAVWWWRSGSSAEGEVRAVFENFATEFNSSTSDGLGLIARAAHIGESFTPDVVIELGRHPVYSLPQTLMAPPAAAAHRGRAGARRCHVDLRSDHAM